MNKREILIAGLGSIVGAIIFSIVTGILWYLLNYFLSKSNSACGGMMGCINFGRNFGSLLTGILGFIEGLISGSIVGLVVIGSRADKMFSFIIGFIINGFMPFIIILFLDGGIDFSDISRKAIFSLGIHCLVGGILGVLMNLIFQLKIFNQMKKLE